MIFGPIYSFFKRVLTLFMRAAAWLIVALSLWVPLFFCIAFLLICVALKKSPGELSTVFWSGLAISIVAAFFVSGLIYDKKRNLKKAKPSDTGEKVVFKQDKARLKKKEQEQLPQAQEQQPALYQPQYQAQNQIQSQQTAYQQLPPQPQYQQPYQQQTQQPVPYQPQYQQPPQEQQPQYKNTGDEFAPRKETLGIAAAENDMQIYQEPKIFATRKDPTIFIYEYPDRLEFRKRTREGMILTETKYKN